MGLLDGTSAAQYYSGNNHGDYQFVSLEAIINQFIIAYVGEQKLISKIKRSDVAFHAQRALAELSFDTFKSCKSQEITLPATLQMILPRDYVNYTKISWIDPSGVKRPLYPTKHTSNPSKYQTDSNNEYLFDMDNSLIHAGELIRNGGFHGTFNNWILNENEFGYNTSGTGTTPGPTTNTQPVSTSTNNIGLEEPEQGWFYGFDGNAVRGYDVVQYQAFRQQDVMLIPGEKYKVTFTISSYTSGTFQFALANSLGGIITGTDRTADGTYEEIVTMPTTGNFSSFDYLPNQIWIRNKSTTNGNAIIDSVSIVRVGDEETSKTWESYKSIVPSENNNDDYEDEVYWPLEGDRYGLDPQHAQTNGSFYIDCNAGKIHFSSNVSGKTVVLDYISDSLGTDKEMRVHKFAEEAIYKHISHAILTNRVGIPRSIIDRFKKEKFAETRKAKLRLSNIKLEEITQILRGKSKQIKH